MADQETYLHDNIITPYYKIRGKLKNQYMTVADVVDVLGVSKRQLFYWDFKGLKLIKETTKKHSWRKFSVFDLFGYAILRELRQFGIGLDICEPLFDWLRENVIGRPFFLFHLAEGDAIFVLIDAEVKNIKHFYGSDILALQKEIMQMVGSKIVIPIGPILRDILSKVDIKDMTISCGEDRFGKNNKMQFAIYDENLYEEMSECYELIDNLLKEGLIEDMDDTEGIMHYLCWDVFTLIDSDKAFADENQYETSTEYSNRLRKKYGLGKEKKFNK